jgi:hypothetical protein
MDYPEIKQPMQGKLFGMLVLRFGRGVRPKILWEESNNFDFPRLIVATRSYTESLFRFSHQDSNYFLFYFVFFIIHIHNNSTNDSKNQSNSSLIVAIHLFFYHTPCLTPVI